MSPDQIEACIKRTHGQRPEQQAMRDFLIGVLAKTLAGEPLRTEEFNATRRIHAKLIGSSAAQ